MASVADLSVQSVTNVGRATRSSHATSVGCVPRIVAVDVLRGITVAGMLLVNDPGDIEHVFSPLRHSAWNGCTLADLVFPFFLFVAGITTHLSLSRRVNADDSSMRRTIVRRAAIIFGLGLLLNAFPFYEKGAVSGPEWLPAALGHVLARLAQLRLLGVLQRVAIAYLVATFVARRASTRALVVTTGVLLLGYWAAMTLLPVPGAGVIGANVLNEPARTLSAWIDRVTLDWTTWGLGWHMWDRTVPYDPEGLFSTIPAVGTVLLGVLAGRWLQSSRALIDRLRALALVGVVAMIVGYAWSFVLPINKPIWSSSYVLFTAGAACIALAMVAWSIDIMRWKRWSKPFLVFGMNPIVAYVGAELLASVLRSSIKFKVDGHLIGTGPTVVRGLESIGVEAHVASLVWAICFVAVCYALLRPMSKRGIFLRV